MSNLKGDARIRFKHCYKRAGQIDNSTYYKRVVIKLGTSLLTGGGNSLNEDYIYDLARQIATLYQEGKELVIVSSGAIAAGRQRLRLERKAKGVPLRQMLAAVGQGYLMRLYQEAFQRQGIIVAQALLTKRDLSDRAGYLNARNTLLGLIRNGVICIINENDVVATDELKDENFGDNDNLSALVANLIDADLLLLLTDTPGLLTADPRLHPEAKLIPEVEDIDEEIVSLAHNTTSGVGTGGMLTKIGAARLALNSGISVVIANGADKDIIVRLVQGERAGTRFVPHTSRLESRKRWLVSGLKTTGRLTVDAGAALALREHNGSLLPAGVREVKGRFERGDVVEIYDGTKQIGRGITNYSSSDIERIKGLKSRNISAVLGYNYGDEVIHRDNMIVFNEDVVHGNRKTL